jgi:PAS domain S-box-containing protein
MDAKAPVLSIRRIVGYCAIYAAFCAAWILGSDAFIEAITNDPARLTRLQNVKGLACLATIGVLLALLLLRLRSEQIEALNIAAAAADQYRALFEDNHHVMLLVDPADARILRANRAARAYYRRGDDPMQGLPLAEITLDSDESTRARLRESAERGECRFTAQHRMPNGQIRDVLVSAERIQLANTTAVCLTVGDVTEQKSLEAQLEESATWMRLYFELPFAGIAITAPDSRRYLRVNKRLCEMFGYSEAELCTKTWADLTHPDDLEKDVEQFRRLLAGEIDGYLIEKRFIASSGAEIPTQINVRCTRDPGGRVALCLASHQDLRDHDAPAAAPGAERATQP